MQMKSRKWLVFLVGSGAACFAACAADVPSGAGEGGDPVGIVRQGLTVSVARTVDFGELQANYPAEVEAKVDPASLAADAIVGWYDKGHNYHEQKMEKNLQTDFGDIVTNPAVLRGAVLR